MDKIGELKEKLCRASFTPAKNKEGEPMTQLVGQNPNGWGKHYKSFNKGFDAAMEVQLPVLFVMWLKDNYNLQNETGIWTNNETGEWKIEPELYDDFKTIYQPEK